jgi:Tol biopolymer transport system component
MTVQPGSRLGPYDILSHAGSGGMGDVYRARDSRLGRDVAVKVLPAQYSADPEWRRRLDREARAISSLSHPHVCPLFDVGHQDGVDYLVMEYLDGETLATRLERGALPLDQVLRYGAEIASALAAAHRQGVVHRDLKPGNVMLTRAGARLLDFGLAKPAAAAASPIEATASAPITAHGTLVGTYPYMAPEQLEGHDADARTDMFALGAVLYEMATGRRAFEGKTTASLIAAILERDPAPVSTVQPLAPAALDDIIRGCLAKDPDDRWQTAHDVKLQLESLRRRSASGAESMDAGSGPVERARRARWLTGIAVAVATMSLAALAAFALWPRTPPPSPATVPVRAPLLPPAGHWFTPNDFQVSPDGRRVAFVASGGDGVSTLWITSLESSQSLEIDGTQGAVSPFWSPDSRWIAFFANGRLLKVEPGGAGLQQVSTAGLPAGGGAWGPGDVIIYSASVLGPLLKVPAGGGTPAPVTRVPDDARGEAHRFPVFLPDGERFLYVASWTNQQRGGLYLGHLDGRPPELVSPDIRGRVVLAGTRLLYVQGGTFYSQPFDAATGRLTGEARSVLRNEVVLDWRFGDVPLSASATGVLVYQSRGTYSSQLVMYDRSGQELEIVGQPGFVGPSFSPDGRYVAVAYDREGTGEWGTTIHDLSRRISSALPRIGSHTAHAWSPDGSWIYYSAIRGKNGIYRRRPDGSGAEEQLLESSAHLLVNSHAPKASRLLFMDFSSGTPAVHELDLDSRATRMIAEGAEAVYSPDGRWIAFISFPGGLPSGMVLMRADGQGSRIPLTSGLASQVRWRADMEEIFYIAPDKKLMSVPLTIRGNTIEPGEPRALFQTRIIQPRLVLFQYDVNRAGDRFVINSLPRADAAAPLTMIVNWESEGKD